MMKYKRNMDDSSKTCACVEVLFTKAIDLRFTLPLNLALMFKKGKAELCNSDGHINAYGSDYGIKERGDYIIWKEEDGTKKYYKLADFERDEDRDEWDKANIWIDEEN